MAAPSDVAAEVRQAPDAVQALAAVDLWGSVPFDHLPPALVAAFEREDWNATRSELRTIMDGLVTDGPYGRELLKLVLRLPIGIDPR